MGQGFRTFSYLAPNKVSYGIDVFPNTKKNKNMGIVKQPFMPYERSNDFQSK